MPDEYQIHLNFLAAHEPLPAFTVYRKPRGLSREDRPEGQVFGYKLPNTRPDEKDWLSFWVSSSERAGFELFHVEPGWNPQLTKRFLFLGLRESVIARLRPDQFHLPHNEFVEEISFVMHAHPEGNETLVIQP